MGNIKNGAKTADQIPALIVFGRFPNSKVDQAAIFLKKDADAGKKAALDAPASAVPGKDAALVQVDCDVLNAHWTVGPVALQGKSVDQPHRIRVQRIDLQLLFDLGAALLGRDDTIADRRKEPFALPGISLQGAQDVLGVLLQLVLVEQCHDLPHHDVHGIVAHLLGDRDELDAVLRELADVKLEFEVVAEEPREAMDDDDSEGCGLRRAGLDHALELGPAVVRGGGAGLDVGLHQLVTARGAIGFALPFLVEHGDAMLGLPGRRDAQIEGGAVISSQLSVSYFVAALHLRFISSGLRPGSLDRVSLRHALRHLRRDDC
jgi:hypothetical protein